MTSNEGGKRLFENEKVFQKFGKEARARPNSRFVGAVHTGPSSC